MLIGIQFIHNFLYNTHKPYRVQYFNHIFVIRGHWQFQKWQKKEVKKKNLNALGDRNFVIISDIIT